MNEPANQTEIGARTAQSVGQAYLLFGVSLILVLTVGAVGQYLSVLPGLVITELILILLPVVVYIRWKQLPIAEALRWRPVPLETAVVSVILGVSGYGVAIGIYLLTVPVLGKGPDIDVFRVTSLWRLLLVFVCGALLPGICEETLFRGAIQGILQRKGASKAVVYSALLFAAFHVNPWSFLPAFFLGVVFGILVARTNSTVPAITAHIANNATAFIVQFMFGDQAESATYPLIGGLACVFAVAFPVFLLRTRGAGLQPPLLSTVPAGVSRRVKWAAGTAAAVLVLLLPATVFAFVGVYAMSSSVLEPDVQRGDRVLVLKSRFLELDIQSGDIVSFRRDGKTYLRKVARLDDENVWVIDDSSERRISRNNVTGKKIHTFRIPD